MKILVTGGAGFIGRHVVNNLAGSNQIRIYDDLSNSSKSDISYLIAKGVDFVKGDVLDYDCLVKSCRGYDVVIHLAAKSDVADSVINSGKTMNVNVNGTVNVVNACKENKVKKIIFASSAAVYGDYNDTITEKSATSPQSPYGNSKLEAERIIEKKCRENDIRYVILRMFNVYGKGQNVKYAGVITKFLENISQNKPLVIYGDGKQTRDFISIHDVIDAFDCAIKSDNSGVYNIGTGRSITINELAEIMFDVFGKKLDATYEDAKKGDIKYSIADVSLAETELRFIAKRSLKEELASICHGLDLP